MEVDREILLEAMGEVTAGTFMTRGEAIYYAQEVLASQYCPDEWKKEVETRLEELRTLERGLCQEDFCLMYYLVYIRKMEARASV